MKGWKDNGSRMKLNEGKESNERINETKRRKGLKQK